MPTRDPQTGKFVSGSTNTAYDDYDVQHTVVEFSPDQTVGAGTTRVEPALSFEPLGGLGRNEVAELVAVLRHISVFAQDSGGASASNANVAMEWSFDSTAHFLQSTDSEMERINDAEGVAGLNILRGEGADIDVLDHYRRGTTTAAHDSTNGGVTGGGHYADWELIPYRNEFGQGPTADRHDEIFGHGVIEHISNCDVQFVDRRSWVWDVVEE